MVSKSRKPNSDPDFDGVSPVAADNVVLEELFTATYEELRRLASSIRRGDPSATISPTALVNEAWLKLAGSPPLVSVSRVHFKRIAARAMRQVLIEAARRRNAQKRGGGLTPVTFDEALDQPATGADDLLASRRCTGGVGAHPAPPGADGGEPVLRWPRHQRDGGVARRLRSHDPA